MGISGNKGHSMSRSSAIVLLAAALVTAGCDGGSGPSTSHPTAADLQGPPTTNVAVKVSKRMEVKKQNTYLTPSRAQD